MMREWANTINEYEIVKLKLERADTLLSLYEYKQMYYEDVYVVKGEIEKLLRAQYVDAMNINGIKDEEIDILNDRIKKQRRLLYVAVAVVAVETLILLFK